MDKPTGAGEALAKKYLAAHIPPTCQCYISAPDMCYDCAAIMAAFTAGAATLLTEQSRQPLSARWQELFWALPPGSMRSKLRALEIDFSNALRDGAEQSRQQEALRELCDAAFDYHAHSELSPGVVGVEKTTRLLQARQDALDTLPAPPQPKDTP